MKTIIERLQANPQVSAYKIQTTAKKSCELFYVLGKLETVRRTRTTDKEVTVYVDGDGSRGDSQFFVYPSTDEAQLDALIAEAVVKASNIHNQAYSLPAQETGEFEVESNFSDFDPMALAAKVAEIVFSANAVEHGSLNAVEIFINEYEETVHNSCGIHKTQHRYDAMVEAIPTYNGKDLSVELYEQYNFSALEEAALYEEIAGKMQEVKARFEAVKPEAEVACPVLMKGKELSGLFYRISGDLNYSSVYAHANLFSIGDRVQEAGEGDPITIDMVGAIPGSVRSASFDDDGMTLTPIRVVENGVVTAYYGANRFGQYLGLAPTGNLRCLKAAPGTMKEEELSGTKYLEIISMSGLQVDFFKDYIGGEVRLALLHEGDQVTPLTGISITGSLKEVLASIRLADTTTVFGGIQAPRFAKLSGMKVF